MEVTIDVSVVLVIRVLGAEKGGAQGAGKMFDMELLIWIEKYKQTMRRNEKKRGYALHAVM